MRKIFRRSSMFVAVLLTLVMSAHLHAQVDRNFGNSLDQEDQDWDPEQAYDDDDYDMLEKEFDEQELSQSEQARDEAATANFDQIMLQNTLQLEKKKKVPRKPMAKAFGLPEQNDCLDAEGDFDDIGSAQPDADGLLQNPGAVQLPLARYESLRSKLLTISKKAQRREAPPVVLGAAQYQGEVTPGALKLKLRLQVTLGAPGEWKTVPLIGDQVVVVKASGSGRPLPLSVQNGYHVWVTQDSGEVSIEVELLVPPRGLRGSIEYDFLVPKTPLTDFACRFPVADLQPRLTSAMHAEVRSVAGNTELKAVLRPTARIHMVGFKDLGETEERQAKLYAESLNLVSVDEDAIELFTVLRYNILYAGTKNFTLHLPKGMTLISADGEGAFHFDLEPDPEGDLLRGETAYPIRNSYEISLRLRRELDDDKRSFILPKPRPLGVEREYGYLGVEVPGKLKLEQGEVKEATPVDVRQLPAEMLESAVSPILRAYRYHKPEAEVQLSATRLPDIEPASGSIDSLRVFTVISAEGMQLSELRIRLRNRLRRSLSLRLPAGAEIRSTLLDGEPVKPSRDKDGALLLPLKRSTGDTHLQAFDLRVVYEQQGPKMAWFGSRRLQLPALDLPVSSIHWDLWLPAKNRYGRLYAELPEQQYWGTGQWNSPSGHAQGGGGPTGGAMFGVFAAGNQAQMQAFEPAPEINGGGSNQGAMPVRIKVPRSGKRLQYQRYWIEAEAKPWVSFRYLRGWLLYPVQLLLGVLCLLALVWIGDGLSRSPKLPLRMVKTGVALAALSAGALLGLNLLGALILLVILALLLLALLHDWFGGGRKSLSAWFEQTMQAHARRQQEKNEAREAAKLARQVGADAKEANEKVPATALFRVMWKLALLGLILIFGIMLLGEFVGLLGLLARPLAG